MFRVQDLLPDSERFFKERFGFGVLAHNPVQHGQIVEAGHRVAMFWPKNLLPDLECFFKGKRQSNTPSCRGALML